MESLINQEFQKMYDEAMFDLATNDKLKEQHDKISKAYESLKLRVILLENRETRVKAEQESLDKIVYMSKYGNQIDKNIRRDWSKKALELFFDGYQFNGIFFYKDKDLIHYRKI